MMCAMLRGRLLNLEQQMWTWCWFLMVTIMHVAVCVRAFVFTI